MTTVKNVNGSSRFSAPSGYNSWLEYWEENTGEKASICGASNCSNGDLVGAHVQKANSTDRSYYITPLCRACNQRTDEFNVYWRFCLIYCGGLPVVEVFQNWTNKKAWNQPV